MKKILIDIGHPAHVHLFKLLIRELIRKKFHVVVTSREKDVTNSLLDHYGIKSISLSRAGKNSFGLLGELIERDWKVFKLHRKQRFDLALGTSVSIAHLSAVTKVRSYIFEEDDDDVVPLFSALTYPFATGIVVPSGLRYKKWRKKRIFHESVHELAYLHPDVFSPDVNILKKYGLFPKKYIILRTSALKAHHDTKIHGLGEQIIRNIRSLTKGYEIISSRESRDGHRIEPWDMHHVLNYAEMLITDSQTMTMEAACLGVPSIRCNSFVGKISCLEEAEHRYGLTFGFKPGEKDGMLNRISSLLETPDLEQVWKQKQMTYLREKENLLNWLLKFVDSVI